MKTTKNKPLLSVIVPVYNAEKYIERCVQSIQNQTYKNLEIILVDDGSPDNCPKLCDELSKTDDRIKVFHKKNGGVSSARNLGIENASGDYIAFVDSDDYIMPDYYESMVEKIADDVDIVVAGHTVIDDNKKTTIISPKTNDDCRVLESKESFINFFLDGHLAVPVNKLYKKSLITNKFQEGLPLGEDRIFNLNYFNNIKQRIVTIDNPGYIYEFNSGSATHKKRNNLYSILKVSLLKLREFLTTKFNSFDCDDYFIIIGDLYYSCYINSDRKNIKQLKKEIKNDVLYNDYTKSYKPKTLKKKLKFFLFKHFMFGLYKFITKIFYK